jgi:hypothetical protein
VTTTTTEAAALADWAQHDRRAALRAEIDQLAAAGATVARLRNRKEVLKRHLERASRTLVAETASGVIIVAHPGQDQAWLDATDPVKGPRYLREQLGILDPSSVKVMSDVPSCMPVPWSEDDERALAEAEQLIAADVTRDIEARKQDRARYEAWVAQEEERRRAATAERERRAAMWGKGVWDGERAPQTTRR